MEREIIPGTQWPEGRIITGDKTLQVRYFKCNKSPNAWIEQEIMNLILAIISCSSQLGAPLVVQSRPLLNAKTGPQGGDGSVLQLLLSASTLPARGEQREGPGQSSPKTPPDTSAL